jgi:segregation and condensation protein B
MTSAEIKPIIEAALLAAGRPLMLDELCALFVTQGADETIAEEEKKAVRKPVREALKILQLDFTNPERGIELVEVANGYRLQVKPLHAPQVKNLWATRATRYSRAMLETLALIAYRQPITRGEIEKVRGVSVNTQIVKTLLEFGWIRIVGHRSTPGRPMLYGTTKAFLDHFSLQSLEDLPALIELQDLAQTDAALLKESSDLDLLSADNADAMMHSSEAATEIAGEEANIDGVIEELEAAEKTRESEHTETEVSPDMQTASPPKTETETSPDTQISSPSTPEDAKKAQPETQTEAPQPQQADQPGETQPKQARPAKTPPNAPPPAVPANPMPAEEPDEEENSAEELDEEALAAMVAALADAEKKVREDLEKQNDAEQKLDKEDEKEHDKP